MSEKVTTAAKKPWSAAKLTNSKATKPFSKLELVNSKPQKPAYDPILSPKPPAQTEAVTLLPRAKLEQPAKIMEKPIATSDQPKVALDAQTD